MKVSMLCHCPSCRCPALQPHLTNHGDGPRLLPRDVNSKNLIFIIVLASITAFAAVLYVVVSFINTRRQRQKEGGQEAGSVGCWAFLSALGRKRGGGQQSGYEQALGDNFDGTALAHPLETTAAAAAAASVESSHDPETVPQTHVQPTTQHESLVDRNTSVRSIMTLPAYRAVAAHDERVMGRAGERGGVDVVVDLPTAEEQESMRDEEMEAIYQIRLATRRRAVEREALGRRGQEAARQRGDGSGNALLAEARTSPSQTPTAASSHDNTIDELRRNVNRIQGQRLRSVSSVSYADLGVARHDGTRLRADSNESERMGLLSNAATFAVSTTTTRPRGARPPGLHRRERSAGSLTSMDSDLQTVHPAARVSSRSATPRLPGGDVDANPSREPVEVDLGVEALPPPEYEDVSLDDVEAGRPADSLQQQAPPPEYEEAQPTPTRDTILRLPSLRLSTLPAIFIEPEDVPAQRL